MRPFDGVWGGNFRDQVDGGCNAYCKKTPPFNRVNQVPCVAGKKGGRIAGCSMTSCIACGQEIIAHVYENNRTPLSRYGFLDQPDRHVQTTEISIAWCSTCHFAWNLSYDKHKVDYKSDKIIEANRFSPRYRSHLDAASLHIKSVIGKPLETVVEIGAGACDFLKLFSEATTRVAIEPSDEVLMNDEASIRTIKDYFDGSRHQFPADLVVFRQVLEHIDQPREFILDTLRGLGKAESSTYFYIEVPNAGKTFADARFYDIYYDHCNYFTLKSLNRLLEACGLTVYDIHLAMQQEIICVIASNEVLNASEVALALERAVQDMNAQVRSHLEQHRRVLVWGAAGNGTNILNTLQIGSNQIPYVIDKDQNKQGKFIPITGQRIISPTEAVDFSPEVVVIMSQFHRLEIGDECRQLFGDKVVLL